MHFSMHYNADPGRSWNNTPGVFRMETNDHQRTSKLKSPCHTDIHSAKINEPLFHGVMWVTH